MVPLPLPDIRINVSAIRSLEAQSRAAIYAVLSADQSSSRDHYFCSLYEGCGSLSPP